MTRSPLLLAFPAAIVVVALLGQGLVRGPTLDASVFAVIAERMLAGGMPYRDVFDHKPPVIYIVEWAAGLVASFIDPWARAWGITVVAALGTLLLVARALGPGRPVGTALALAGLAPLLGAQYFSQGGGQTESLAVLPATAGFIMAVDRARLSSGRALSAGVLMGIGGAASFQILPVAAGAAASLLVARRGIALVAAYVAGGAAVAVVLIAWIAAGGALPAMLEQLVVYNRAYLSGQSFLHPIPVLNLTIAVTLVAPVAGAVVLRLVELVRRRRAEHGEAAAGVAVVGWSVLVGWQGQFIGHYAIVLAAPLAILSVPVLDRFASWLADRRTRLLAVVVAAFAVLFPLVVVRSTEPGTTRRPPIDAAASTLTRLTTEGSRVFVWGNEPYVYLLSAREPASRYVYLFPLTQSNFTTDAMVADVLRDWDREPPAAIVDASVHSAAVSAHPLLGPWVFAGGPVRDKLDPLRDYVRANYRLAAVVEEWRIYVSN